MLRAISAGFMPSTEQTIINLRTILAADFLNPDNPDLSDSGRKLLRYTKQWLKEFMELLQHKNKKDQIQDFIWFLSKSRISLDTADVSRRASKIRARADATAGMCDPFEISHSLMIYQPTRAFELWEVFFSQIPTFDFSLVT